MECKHRNLALLVKNLIQKRKTDLIRVIKTTKFSYAYKKQHFFLYLFLMLAICITKKSLTSPKN